MVSHFPDIYDIGQTNLGLAMLYHILNQEEDILAERSFAHGWTWKQRCGRTRIPLFRLKQESAQRI